MVCETLTQFQAEVVKTPYQGTLNHAWAVYGLIRSMQPKVVLETGTYGGFVTAHIALALQHNEALGFPGELYSIDNYSYQDSIGPERVWNHLKACGVWSKNIHLIIGSSMEVKWPKEIDFAFLDGDRTLPNFKGEVLRVIKHGAKCFCVHDTHHDPNAHWFMYRFKQDVPGWDVINFPHDGGLAVALKQMPGFIGDKPYSLQGWFPPPGDPRWSLQI